MLFTTPGAGLGLGASAGRASEALLNALKLSALEPVALTTTPAGKSAVGEASADAAGSLVRTVDQVVIRAASPITVFREMAMTGLRQLGALLPVIERQAAVMDAAPLGHLARAVGDAAYQVGAGFAAVAGLPEHGPPMPGVTAEVQDDTASAMAPVRAAARQTLQQASEALEQISARLQPALAHPPPEPEASRAPAGTDLLWAMTQVAGAQRQICASMVVLATDTPSRKDALATPRRRIWRSDHSRQLDPATSAIALFGAGLLLCLMAFIAGIWFAAVITIGLGLSLGTALAWGWRVVFCARGLRIELRRPRAD